MSISITIKPAVAKHAANERGFINLLIAFAMQGAEAITPPIPRMEREQVTP
jgi:hypothetical protein